MAGEKFHLTWPPWHSYSDHLKEMMHIMKTDDTFTDVTLVSDDGRKVKAHKVVLGASSPIMKDMMTRENKSIVNLKGIAYEEIDSILQFIYLGEATLHPDRMKEFLVAAQKMKVKELCKESKMIFERNNAMNFEHQQIKKEVVMHTSEQYDKDCTKQANKQSVLATQIQSIHEGEVSLKYPCNQCDHQFTQKSNLTTHIKSVHEGVKYACNHCDYQATTQGNLKIHIQALHEGVKYACNQCDYQATEKGSLKTHIQSIHDGDGACC